MTCCVHLSTSSGRAGISLLEVLVVLTIVSVVAGSVAPAIRRDISETALEAEARQVKELVGRARRTAITRGVPITLTVDASGGRYWVIETASRMDSVIATGSLPMAPGVRLESTAPRAVLRFAPTGEVTRADVLVMRGSASSISISSAGWSGSGADHER
jgi:prepilin-type N-terminal cleavage/methylation domain-containing protein